VAELFGVPEEPSLFPEPRYNIAPGQPVPVVIEADGGRRLRGMRWGLVPSWATDPKVGFRSINARSETVSTRPAFRAAFKRRHCLVPASGFYDWRTVGKQKLPTLFRPAYGLFGFAGLWETWHAGDDGEPLDTFTILTTDANATLAPTHERMPVIVEPTDYATWLDATKSADGSLRKPRDSSSACRRAVTSIMNPRTVRGAPPSSATFTTSWIQTVRPSPATIRFSNW
jgi:putative SOS response-associated peptidase YedK